ncbi:MAG: hypothetical protein AAF907_01630, partial [Planctomycetota bacterium]
ELELVAVQRPGWVQVFRFRLRAKDRETGDWEELRGLARDDERIKKKADRTVYRLTPTEEEYDTLFAEWSEGLLTLRSAKPGETGPSAGAFVIVALTVLGILGLSAFAASRLL